MSMNILKILIAVSLFFSYCSCNSKREMIKKSQVIYDIVKDSTILLEEHEQEQDISDYPFSLCIIFENSIKGDKIFIQNLSSKEVVFDKKLKGSSKNNISRVVFIGGPKNHNLNINNKSIYIEANMYKEYRYLVVNKNENKYLLTYTNEYPHYSYSDLCKLSKTKS